MHTFLNYVHYHSLANILYKQALKPLPSHFFDKNEDGALSPAPPHLQPKSVIRFKILLVFVSSRLRQLRWRHSELCRNANGSKMPKETLTRVKRNNNVLIISLFRSNDRFGFNRPELYLLPICHPQTQQVRVWQTRRTAHWHYWQN